MTPTYRALLHLLPASFRHEYGGEMLAVFEARMRRAPGARARAGLLVAGALDIARSAAAVHRDLLLQDLRYTLRTLRRAPGFATTAVLVTALGIGASTAAFSVADFVLRRPLPFPAPERLVTLWAAPSDGGRVEMSPPNYRDFVRASQSYSAMGAYHGLSANLVGDGEPQRIEGTAVTAELLPLLGVQPLVGRLPLRDDAGDSDDLVLSHDFWQAAFGGDSAVLGTRMLVNGSQKVIVGVMPPSFVFPSRRSAIWTIMPREERENEERDNNWFSVVGRLRDGVSIEQARTEARTIAAELERRYPREMEQVSASVFTLRDQLSNQSRVLLLGLCAASLLVLVVACTNLANLLLARTLVRRRELVLRTALGAGRERLARQLVTESVVLTGAGGALGVLVAVAAVPILTRLIPTTLPISASPGLDLRILLATGVVTTLTGLAFGTVPALRAAHAAGSNGFDAMREGARGGARSRLRGGLVTAQVTACVVLLVSSGLLTRALLRVQDVDPGFRADGAFMARTALTMPAYATVARRAALYGEVLDRVRALPGVSDAAYVSSAPMVGGGGIFPVEIPGKTEDRGAGHRASLRFATPRYFATMGIAMRRGRDLADSDDAGGPPVAVVSESFAGRYWPGEDPLGKRFTFGFAERTVVGVVADVRMRGLERRSEPQVYIAYRQVPDSALPAFMPKDLVVRASATPASLVPAIRRIVHAVDPQLPVSDVQTLDEIIDGQTTSRTVQVRVLTAFAASTFLLAAIGIHGLLSFMVSSRRREIGVRMALGATPRNVLGLVVRQALTLTLAGVVPGLVLSYLAGQAMETLLMGVRPTDIVTYGTTMALCVTMSLIGGFVPALRAVRVPPATALRAD